MDTRTESNEILKARWKRYVELAKANVLKTIVYHKDIRVLFVASAYIPGDGIYSTWLFDDLYGQ